MHDGVDRLVVDDVAVVGDLLRLVLGAAVDLFGRFFAIAIEHVADGGDFDLAFVLQLDGRIEMRLGPAADADEAEPQPLVGAVEADAAGFALSTAGAAMATAVAAAEFLMNVRRETVA